MKKMLILLLITSPGSYTLYVNGAAYATGEFTNTKEAQQ
jgi:hypothetical protein